MVSGKNAYLNISSTRVINITVTSLESSNCFVFSLSLLEPVWKIHLEALLTTAVRFTIG